MDTKAASHQRYFHPVDYAVFAFMFMISLSIGAFFAFRSRNKNTPDEYLMGGRKLKLLPVAISICVSVISANTLLGAPAEMYSYGVMYEFVCVAIIFATVIVALLYVPLIYPLKLTSAHKYLFLRFRSKIVQYLGTCLLLLAQVAYTGCVIFGPATALQTGIPPWASILFVGVFGTAYTAIGGMKAVIWTDVFQSTVMITGLIALIIQGTRKVGGFKIIWDINMEGGRLDIKTTSSVTERMSLSSSILGLMIYWIGAYGVNQPCVQRYCAMDTQRQGRLAILLNGPGFIIFTTLSMMAGMVAFAYYDLKQCDPLSSGIISNGNQIIPYFVMEILGYPGMPGLFISSLFSACLSTLSSSVNSMAAVLWEDVLIEHCDHFSNQTKTWITKGLSLLFGILCMCVSFMIMVIGGNLIQVSSSLLGMSIGPLLGVFTLGALFPFANAWGALFGGLTGIGFNTWLLIGQVVMNSQRERLPTKTGGCFEHILNETLSKSPIIMTSNVMKTPMITSTVSAVSPSELLRESAMQRFMYSISFSWYPLIGLMLALLIGVIVSLATSYTEEPTTNGKDQSEKTMV